MRAWAATGRSGAKPAHQRGRLPPRLPPGRAWGLVHACKVPGPAVNIRALQGSCRMVGRTPPLLSLRACSCIWGSRASYTNSPGKPATFNARDRHIRKDSAGQGCSTCEMVLHGEETESAVGTREGAIGPGEPAGQDVRRRADSCRFLMNRLLSCCSLKISGTEQLRKGSSLMSSLIP